MGVCVILYFKSVIREVFYKMYVLCSIEIKLYKKKKECVNTVQSTFHVVLCLLYTY